MSEPKKPWVMREPWITYLLVIMALLAGFGLAEIIFDVVEWLK